MNIAITGATGFIGGYLSTRLEKQGHRVTPISRDLLRKESRDKLVDVLEKCDAVINLAGYPIRCRWTPAHQQLILESRVSVTKTIVETINGLARKPSVFISASAVGIYPSNSTTPSDESALRQETGFLAHVCRAWEEEAANISPETRRVITRFGVVLDPSGGAFPSMIQPLRFGISTIIGKGDQPLAWISRTDLSRAMEFILRTDSIRGIVNLTAPARTTYASLADELALRSRPWITLHIPAWVLKLAMGESASVLLDGQWVIPGKLLDAGFSFSDPNIRSFLDNNLPPQPTS